MDKATERQRHTEHCSLTSCHSSCWFSFRSYEKRHDKLVEACHNALRQIEQVYTKGDPKTEGLCLSIRGLRAILKEVEGV